MTAFAPRPDGRVAPTTLRLKAWIRRSLVHHSRGRQPPESGKAEVYRQLDMPLHCSYASHYELVALRVGRKKERLQLAQASRVLRRSANSLSRRQRAGDP